MWGKKMKNKLFILGDFKSTTGPGIANAQIKKGFLQSEYSEFVSFSEKENKIHRVLEMIIKILFADALCICSLSFISYTSIMISKLLNKKIYYVMHGYKTYELSFQSNNIKEVKRYNKLENFIFKNSASIYCVSKTFRDFMVESEPKYADKFDYNFNGIDLEKIKYVSKNNEINKKKNEIVIVSAGGGKKQKNNLMVAKAIETLIRNYQYSIEYHIIGNYGEDISKIANFDFVTVHNKFTYIEMLEFLRLSNIYVQNSKMETFGLALVEAMLLDNNILASSNIGSLGLFENLSENNIINDTFNSDEIAKKLESLIRLGNNFDLKSKFDEGKIDPVYSSTSLYKKIFSIK